MTLGSIYVVNEFFESRYVTVLVKVFSHDLAFLRQGVSVFTKLNVFGKHLFIVVDVEGNNILTISPSTAHENVPLTSICSYI